MFKFIEKLLSAVVSSLDKADDYIYQIEQDIQAKEELEAEMQHFESNKL